MLQLFCLLVTLQLSPPGNSKTYTDSLHRYTVQYPANWTQGYYSSAVTFLRPPADSDIFRENVNIILQDMSTKPLTLEQYTELSKKQYSSSYGPSSVISVKDTMLSGYKAEVGLFLVPSREGNISIKQYWFIKDNTAYLLTYTALPTKFSKYLPSAMGIIGSIKLTK